VATTVTVTTGQLHGKTDLSIVASSFLTFINQKYSLGGKWWKSLGSNWRDTESLDCKFQLCFMKSRDRDRYRDRDRELQVWRRLSQIRALHGAHCAEVWCILTYPCLTLTNIETADTRIGMNAAAAVPRDALDCPPPPTLKSGMSSFLMEYDLTKAGVKADLPVMH
jgi:hypothetical protein